MNLLLDTNIILEILLDQERAQEARELLEQASHHRFYLSDFSLFSIGLRLFRNGSPAVFSMFLNDMIGSGIVKVVRVPPSTMDEIVDAANSFALDFDDAYQYAAAKRRNAEIVSFDADFDRTNRGRLTPRQALERR